jgi:hypothetical protein
MFRIFMAAVMIMGLLLVDNTTASDQLYRFRDANGNWRYTDNLADVPTDQRENCKKYDALESSAEQPTGSPKVKGEQPVDPSDEARRLRAELKERKTGLDQEYEALVEESDVLEKMSLNLQTTADKIKFENRKDKFNRRVKAFEEKRQAFTKDLQAYNNIAGRQKN